MEQQEVSTFQERAAFIVGGATMLSLGIKKRRPHWGGVVVVGMGLLLVRTGLRWIQSQIYREHRTILFEPEPKPLFDIVSMDSMDSVPASDAPS